MTEKVATQTPHRDSSTALLDMDSIPNSTEKRVLRKWLIKGKITCADTKLLDIILRQQTCPKHRAYYWCDSRTARNLVRVEMIIRHSARVFYAIHRKQVYRLTGKRVVRVERVEPPITTE